MLQVPAFEQVPLCLLHVHHLLLITVCEYFSRAGAIYVCTHTTVCVASEDSNVPYMHACIHVYHGMEV